jgi:hypothetical protein
MEKKSMVAKMMEDRRQRAAVISSVTVSVGGNLSKYKTIAENLGNRILRSRMFNFLMLFMLDTPAIEIDAEIY